ncbi:MAG TPA: DUF1697 domain-containing protein [Ornithinicoccus sp.]|nr:DUF1697 domain-containing protein [Ornithinicoccus sp.]
MPTYVGFLRAINLGARRKFPKDAIRASAEAAGFTDVETYINTGNVRVATRMRSVAKVEQALERAFAADRGFDVDTVVFALPELTEEVEYAAQLADQSGPVERHLVYLMREPLGQGDRAKIEGRSTGEVSIVVRGRTVNLLWQHATPGDVDPLGAAGSAMGISTSRNLRVLTEIVHRWA